MRFSAETDEYDAPVAKRRRVATVQEIARSRAEGEVFDRDEVRELLGDCTDSHTRQPARPQMCRQFGDTFNSLAGALVAAQSHVLTVEMPSLERHTGTLSAVRRDLRYVLIAVYRAPAHCPANWLFNAAACKSYP